MQCNTVMLFNGLFYGIRCLCNGFMFLHVFTWLHDLDQRNRGHSMVAVGRTVGGAYLAVSVDHTLPAPV